MLNQIVSAITEDREPRTGNQYFSGKITEYADYSSKELDQLFHILRNQRRRDVLEYLQAISKQVTLGDLAEHIAARECEKPIVQLRSQERKRVYVGLRQSHLPKMDDFGMIDYDSDRGTIEPGPEFDRVSFFLRGPAEPSVERNQFGGTMTEGET